MAANHKLTKVIAGRVISDATAAPNGTLIAFSDGSKMSIKTAGGSVVTVPGGAVIDKVRQQGTELDLDCRDGKSVKIPLAEATSSVMLRNAAGALEYAD